MKRYGIAPGARTLALIALALAAATLPARATTFIRLSLEQLTGFATHIVHARAIESHSEWNAARTTILTYTTFEVLDSIKGTFPEERVVVRQLGGKVGHLVMHVHGEPRFEAGEEAILFLTEDPEQAVAARIVGMAQGAYRVERERATGRKFVATGLEEAVYFDPRTRTFAAFSERLSLEEFKQKMRRLVAGEVPTRREPE